MRQYELTVLIHPDLEMNLQPALDKVTKIINSVGGKIIKETNEGKKRLSYSIAKQDFAVYYYYELELPSEDGCAKKISDNLNIADEIIRHLIVIVDENRKKYEAAKRKAQKEDAEAEEGAKTEEEK